MPLPELFNIYNMEIAGIYFPTLPSGTHQCSNKQFLNDENPNGAIKVDTFYSATENYMLLTNEINYRIGDDEDEYNYADGIQDLQAYQNYLSQGLITLGDGFGYQDMDGTSANGFTGWYWHLAEETHWFFGVGTSGSCNENRTWCMARHATGNLIRNTYVAKLTNCSSLIETLENAQQEQLEYEQIQNEIDTLLNENAVNDAETDKNLSNLRNANFANHVEIIAIGGAVLILMFTAWKTLKK